MSKLLLILIFFASLSVQSYSQDTWKPTSGPVRPQTVTALAVAGNGDFIAVTPKGIYTSNDMGKNWNMIEKGHISSARNTAITTRDSLVIIIGDFVIDNSEGFIAYISKDYGRSWLHRSLGKIIGYYDSTRVIVDRKGNAYFCAGQKLFFSPDTCQTYKLYDNSRPEFITALAADSSNTIYVGYASGLIYTTDEGQRWDTTESGRYVASIAVTPGNNVVTVTDIGLSVKESSSMTWQTLTNIMPGITYYITTWKDELYAATSYGIHRFDFKAKDWISTGLNEHGVIALSLADNGLMLAGAGKDGLFCSTDQGTKWIDVNVGLFNQRITTLAIVSKNKIYGLSPNDDLYTTTDQGDKWTAMGMRDRYPIAAVCSNDTVFVITYDGFTYYFTDEIDYTNYIETWYPILNLIKRGSRIYGYTDSEILRMNISKSSWERAVVYVNNTERAKSISVDDYENFFIIYQGNGELRLYDYNDMKYSLFDSGINSFVAADNDTYYAIKDGKNLVINHFPIISDWQTLPIALGQGQTCDKLFAFYDIGLQRNIIIATVIHEGQNDVRTLLRSTDEGKTWEDYTAGLRPTMIFSLMYDGSHALYAATEDGVYRADNVTGVEENHPQDNELPINIYPNPAKDFLYINRGREDGEMLNISIINVLGEVVYKNDAVTGYLKIDCRGFAPGVYFIRTGGEAMPSLHKLIIE